MRFISLQENLKRGLNTVGHVTTKNISLPILNNILIKAEENNIELIGTNLEIGIIYKLRGKVEKNGQFTVDSRLITDYVSLLSGDDKVKVEEKEGVLRVECGNYKTKIKGEAAKEFPLIPSISKKNYYQCSVEGLKKALNSVVFAVSNSENRVELSGVFFSFQEKLLTLVATDSYRLAEKKVEVGFFDNDSSSDSEEKENNGNKYIVPAKTIQELLRILNNWSGTNLNNEADVKIYLSDNQILFSIDSVDLISRLINGQYPDYEQVIPIKSQTEVTVERSELVRAVKAASLFSKAGINDVFLQFLKNKIRISSSSGLSGESQIEIDSESSGSDNEMVVNHRYLIDGLSNINSNQVRISVLNSDTPCVLRPEDDDSYLYIVMPIRQ